MKALLLSEYKKFELADLPRPTPGPDEILVQVAACGICGSDVHGYDGTSGRRIPPIVMGHEAAGTVAEIGSGVSAFKKGDRVTFDSTVYCGKCDYCLSGQVNLCDFRQVVGVSCGDYRRYGAFAEYVVVPQRIVYRLPDALSFPEAAMLEAVSVALHAVRVSEMRGGETALVIGAGMIGLLTLQSARAAGAARVLITDLDATRLKLAKEMGADDALHLSGAELIAEVMRLTAGKGVDVVLEAVGRNETISTAIDCVRKGGTVTLIGNIKPEITLPLQKVVSREIRLQGTAASAGEYPQAIELMTSGKIRVKPLITAVAPLDEGPNWFDRLHAGEPNLMKIVLAPQESKVIQ
ncbi:galactitol-1-phosphate 5-dehydrogenase [Alloacidobacterium dinghuense]|uniref:Galactitol-1-phosphate 5-dehydrogenase n=1 Tax=Alloacidobacterium dinghuense TaxID=2763107 RepID=A0A7G8BKD8_9BACT|nr:galactitol-1-phosphate 5-dehydrogenase [Alloacidobacterium dinghuense]QNI33008.1 galactitol-1-phosphate 5-dehydrogenase [Alloacidobacterium dinghuense]